MAKIKFGSWLNKATTLLGGFRPAVPAALGTVALTFLFAAVMPMAWVRGLAWNLYLDRLSPLFVPPVGDAGRLALAIAMALVAGLLAVLIALAATTPEARGNDDADALQRRRADRHPDDAPRPPIRATRDLPAEGLGPMLGREMAETDDGASAEIARDVGANPGVEASEGDADWLELTPVAQADDGEPLVLGDLAPPEDDLSESAMAAPADPEALETDENAASLAAMVARFETGMERRRQIRDGRTSQSVPTDAANEDDEPPIDFALEAALSTLQRMSRSALG